MFKSISRVLTLLLICLFTAEVVSGITLEVSETEHQFYVSDGSHLDYSFHCLFEESFEIEEEEGQGAKVELHLDESRHNSSSFHGSIKAVSVRSYFANLNRFSHSVAIYKAHHSFLI